MKNKFKRYWTTRPYLYSFGFILDPQMRLTKFFDILILIGENMGIPYTATIYKDTETHLYAVFSSYEDEFCDEDTQPPKVEVSHYDSLVKRMYPMLAACGTSQSSSHHTVGQVQAPNTLKSRNISTRAGLSMQYTISTSLGGGRSTKFHFRSYRILLETS